MKNTILVLSLSLFTSFGFGKFADFEGHYNVGLEGMIENGEVQVSEAESDYEAQVKAQLSFLVGALNGIGGTFDFHASEIKVGTLNPETKKLSYSAKVFVSWPKSMKIPQMVSFPIPMRGDSAGIKDYFIRYSRDCSENPGSHDLDEGSFFYYYRPQNFRCPVTKANVKPVNVTSAAIKVGLSSTNSTGKSPEYGKIWEDNELTVTIIVGNNEPGSFANSDPGVSQYNSMYSRLWQAYGKPKSMNVPLTANSVPGFKNPDIEMTFEFSDKRLLNINLLMIDKYQLLSPSSAFLARLQKRIEDSDFVAYNGHSGLGVNIQALVDLGKYKAGKYQIFYFNGCDTFSYIDTSLVDEHHALNPSYGRHKFIDIISNSMPSPFNGFVMSNLGAVSALLGKTSTYKNILAQFSSMQRAVVMGEEDNLWPKPFE